MSEVDRIPILRFEHAWKGDYRNEYQSTSAVDREIGIRMIPIPIFPHTVWGDDE